jgi:purine-binding chemotaxis protein CheW
MNQSSINWDEIKSRVQYNEMALQESLGRSPANIKAVFRKRAIRLAQSDTADKLASAGSPALIFRLARERYAIELNDLAEVLPFRGCAHVPGRSSTFLGVINLRGEIRPVIDLGATLSENSRSESGFILILRKQVGLKVDDIEELREIHPGELTPSNPGRYARRLVSEPLMLLDVGALLSGVMSLKESLTR